MITDSPSIPLRSTADTLPLSDSASPNGRTATDTLPLQDSAANNARSTADTVGVVDSPSTDSPARDSLALSDRALPGGSARDAVALSDSPSVQTTIFHAVAASDTVSIGDGASPGSSVVDIAPISDSLLVDSTEFFGVLASDIVAIGDDASIFSSIIDLVSISDIAAIQSNPFYGIVASDVVAVVDAASAFSSVVEVVGIADAVSLPLTSVTDIVDIVITTSIVTTKSIVDQMAVGEAFSDIAAVFNRSFSEILALPDCVFTNESGVCSTVGIGRIIIADLIQLMFISVNNPAEQLSAQDQLARNYTGGRDATEPMQVRDSGAMSAASPPPPPPPAIAAMPAVTMAMTETMGEIEGLAEPAEAVEVGGTWNISAFDNGNLESLLAATGMPVYNVSTMAGSAGIEEMTMVLPSFLLSVEVDGEPSNDGVFLTPTVSDLPEGMQVMVPINAEDSMDDTLGPLGNMTLSFTPAASAGNVTMMIAMLDNNPEQDVAAGRPDGAPAFYVDVSFAGDFAGATPSDGTFFEEGPQLTFTLTEEWALENELRLPRINLFLLDETTGEWVEINIGLPGNAVDGVYTYTVTLPHLSTYVVTADRVRDGNDAGEHAVSLSESLFITSSAIHGGAAGSEGSVADRGLAESLAITEVQPAARVQRVITIDDVQVAVNIADIRTAPAFGTAIATLDFEITNTGDSAEELALEYWYSDAEGKRIYEDRLEIVIDAGASSSTIIEIPFSSAGVYDIMIEVASQGGTLATTGAVVEVPWLAVYLYVLVAMAIVVVAASAGIVVYAIRYGSFR